MCLVWHKGDIFMVPKPDHLAFYGLHNNIFHKQAVNKRNMSTLVVTSMENELGNHKNNF